WNALYAAPLRRFIQPHPNDRNPDRRLRIGYVSPDFRQHVVGRNLLPLLQRHDRANFEIFCYSNVIHADSMTEKLRSHADQWRNITDQTDQSAAQMIRNDRIDILVDMSLHMAGNRLLIFAAKPAPVQATFMGYPGSTGLETVDYRLTDPYLDPPGMFDAFYSEKSIRLPETFWCYDPLAEEASVNELPALKNNYITFGCLNNFCKVNDDVIALWGKVFTAIPDSRLLLSAPAGESRERIPRALEKIGIDPRRLEFADFLPRSKYLMLYHTMDIGLDTLPYNGHSTSLDSFWMGVPVVTLVGKTAVGRAGWSQLCNLDLKELSAPTPEEYVEIVTKLAGDLPRLAELRRTLRPRMQVSGLMNAKRFADNVEAAYREMWRAAVNCDAI
ncbi:MAG TPA: hypothetical protein VKJ65_00200, partial [Phycisphaerae bacterium]|nr:hypothetical protein [Phycisphaerae bacterium]